MLPSTPGPSEDSSSEVVYPGERGRADGGEAGPGVPPQVRLGPVASLSQAAGREEKPAAGTRPACTSSHRT